MISRRIFLKDGGLALVSLGFAPQFLARTGGRGGAAAEGAGDDLPARRGRRTQHDRAVRRARLLRARGRASRSRSPARRADAAIDLDGFFGLHPRLAPLKPLYDARQLAIVHACGSPDGTRSHFDAQDYMETATPGVKSTEDGWLNRYLHAREHETGHAVPRRRAGAAAAARAAGSRAGARDRPDRSVRHPRRTGDRHGAGVVRSGVRGGGRQRTATEPAARRSTPSRC